MPSSHVSRSTSTALINTVQCKFNTSPGTRIELLKNKAVYIMRLRFAGGALRMQIKGCLMLSWLQRRHCSECVYKSHATWQWVLFENFSIILMNYQMSRITIKTRDTQTAYQCYFSRLLLATQQQALCHTMHFERL